MSNKCLSIGFLYNCYNKCMHLYSRFIPLSSYVLLNPHHSVNSHTQPGNTCKIHTHLATPMLRSDWLSTPVLPSDWLICSTWSEDYSSLVDGAEVFVHWFVVVWKQCNYKTRVTIRDQHVALLGKQGCVAMATASATPDSQITMSASVS